MNIFQIITLSFSFDPNNRRALAGLMALGHTTGGNLDSSYVNISENEEGNEMQENPLEMIEIPHNDPDPESESDVMWSDVEIDNINNP